MSDSLVVGLTTVLRLVHEFPIMCKPDETILEFSKLKTFADDMTSLKLH